MAQRATKHTGGRSPAEIRAGGNRLRGEDSLYLRQHANNPIDWYPWGREALARAQEEDKPVFLSIGYSSCHWCHVMEHEVFEHDEVAVLMNAHFISIKVDREERPDLDDIYMRATQAFTGNGGWPMSVFLTPDLKPFYAGTYFPRRQFLALASALAGAYAEKRHEVANQAEMVYELIQRDPAVTPRPPLDETVIEDAVAVVQGGFDAVWGGLGAAPKFPMPPVWQFLLHRHRKTGTSALARMIRFTLDRIRSGGIHDHIGGGFHRYAVDRTWLVPHFEKMLYDNAQLASLYLEASVVFRDSRYEEVARDALDFMLRDMTGPEGAFYASYDADSGGTEGSFYVWTPEEIAEAVSERDGRALAELLGVTAHGNFEGSSIPTRRAAHDSPELFRKWVHALREYRSLRVWPGLDRKIIAAWNGLALGAFAQGFMVLGERRYLEAASSAADYLLRVHLRPDGSLCRSSYDGRAANEGMLDDVALLAWGLLELFSADGDSRWAEAALALIDQARARFRRETGGWYMSPQGHEAPLGRSVDAHDGVMPSGYSAMLSALHKGSLLASRDDWRQDIRSAVVAYPSGSGDSPLGMVGLLDTLQRQMGPSYTCVVLEGDDAEAGRAFTAQVRRSLLPHVALVPIEGTEASENVSRLLPVARGRHALSDRPTAFVCTQDSCRAPETEPDRLLRLLLEGWAC